MARLNTKPKFNEVTHEGAKAAHINPEQALRRSVLSCLLWEREFYEEGEDISARIVKLCESVAPATIASLAIEARSTFNLRHVPLLLLSALARHARGNAIVSDTIEKVIQRADELSEFLVIHAKLNGVTPDKLKGKISAQMKKGLALAFAKFDAYQLGKYDRANAVRLRDVMFLSHPKPKDEAQASLWKQLVANELPVPDTWEVALSGGADKKETFERLMRDGKLGYLALLRNLRNMTEAGCDEGLIRETLLARKGADRVFPFRFIAAAKAAPKLEAEIDAAMVATLSQMPKLPGKTIVVIDVSGSMYGAQLSAKSDMNRALAACALGSIARELCEKPAIYATAGSDGLRQHKTKLVPARRGMALTDAIYGLCRPLGGGGIFLKQVMDYLLAQEKTADRTIVITDEQDCGVGSEDSPLAAKPFGKHNYIINVASAKNGIGYGQWVHIDGFAESVFRFIQEYEAE